MAQNDMNIANQGFPGFRADLNDALAALVSNSSGATAPATTFAHQFWVDTSANPSVLKIRNADNDAFITIGTINQTNDTFTLTPAGGVSTDTISELTAAAGVTIDGVLLKDTTVTANTVKASGTASSQGKVEFFEDTDNGTNFVALQAPAAIASDVTFTLPAADGTSGQVIQTDGSGALSFATAGATIATTAEAEAGTNNTAFITPLRLREGFNASGTAPVFACRAWVNFNGTGVVAIRDDGNVSSITDHGAGEYTINMTTAMPDVNYALTGTASQATSGARSVCFSLDAGSAAPTTSTVRINTRNHNSQADVDCAIINAAIFR